jgi:hypothetical protein
MVSNESLSLFLSLFLYLFLTSFYRFSLLLPYLFPFFFIFFCALITLSSVHSLVSSLFLSLVSLLLFLATYYYGPRRSVFISGPADRLPWHKGLPSAPPAKSWDRRPTRTGSFHIHSNLLFTNHPTIT